MSFVHNGAGHHRPKENLRTRNLFGPSKVFPQVVFLVAFFKSSVFVVGSSRSFFSAFDERLVLELCRGFGVKQLFDVAFSVRYPSVLEFGL